MTKLRISSTEGWKQVMIECFNVVRLLRAVIYSLKSDFDANSEIRRQTAEHVKLNVLEEDKCESRY